MAVNPEAIWGVIKSAGTAWVEDKAPRLGAALSYYTIFAIPPLFVIVVYITSLLFDPEMVRTELFSEVGGLIGEKSAATIETAMAGYQGDKGIVASIMAAGTLLLLATGLFIELQDALNTIWGVKSKPGQGIRGFIRNRVLSFAMVVGIGFLLLVSLVISAVISALSKYGAQLVPGLDVLWMMAEIAVSFAVITVLFAMLFKVLPDVKLAWRDVWVGAAVTALLFTGGKFLLGLYLAKSTAVTAYGAAGSLVLILLWVYYSSQILFFGAEVTQVYANRFGSELRPSDHAEWISDEEAAATGARVKNRKGRMARKEKLLEELREEVGSLRTVVKRTCV